MTQRLWVAGLAIVGLSAFVIADVPHEFGDVSQTKLNENFQNLDNRSTTLEANIRELKAVVRNLAVAVPPDAIVAFDSSDCPAGWSPFREGEGRFLIGTGNNDGRNEDGAGLPLTARPLMRTGGAERHALTPSEMPKHSHPYSRAKRVKRGGGDKGSAEYPSENDTTGSSGDGKPHNNVPPFVALKLCRKN